MSESRIDFVFNCVITEKVERVFLHSSLQQGRTYGDGERVVAGVVSVCPARCYKIFYFL